MTKAGANGKAALVIAHPGHELCVYGWLETARPHVFVLTDGSGRTATSRLDSTTKILFSVGASPGSIYGRFTDQNLYAAILQGDFALFERLVSELTEALVREEIEHVAGDALEGYNSIHDTCRLIIDAAVELASYVSGRSIINSDFLLLGRHDANPERQHASATWLRLDDDTLARKLGTARAYPELKGEVDTLLDQQTPEILRSFPALSAHFDKVVTRARGNEAYRVECLRRVGGSARNIGQTKEIPFYERYGEMLVAAGVYERAIRYREHFLPLAEAISHFVDTKH